MKKLETEQRQELIFYGALWAVIFALVPVVFLFLGGSGHRTVFQFRDVVGVWAGILPFFILFIVHDLLVAPLLVEKRKTGVYLVLAFGLMAVFTIFVWTTWKEPRWADDPHGGRPPVEWSGREDFPIPSKEKDRPMPPPDRGLPLAPQVMHVLMGMMVLGVNLGVKYYFESVRGERRVQELKAENLDRQLENLRYQINPHFFLNTLNNIHALVDIDPEKAKESIEEFSKLMRYVLYEGDRPTIPLSREQEYLRHYVSLMRIRYADTVRIELSLPESAENAEIPPLVLASFVENAFKHGISYERPSFVQVSLSLEEDGILFRCVNSRQGAEQVRSHGIGLANVRRRLELLYGERYMLHIDENAEVYDILLRLPLSAGTGTAAV